jgi:hypothetical protein
MAAAFIQISRRDKMTITYVGKELLSEGKTSHCEGGRHQAPRRKKEHAVMSRTGPSRYGRGAVEASSRRSAGTFQTKESKIYISG